MASSSGTVAPGVLCGENCGANTIGRGWDPPDAHAGGIMNRVQDCRGGRDDCLLADSFRSKRPDWRGILDEDRLHRRHVTDGRDQVVVKILALPRKKLFHQGVTQTLRRAAFDLSFNEGRVDRASHVVSGRYPQHLHGSEFRIDRDLRHVRPKAEHGVRYTLAVFIERAGRRIERGFRSRNVSELVARKLREMNRLLTAALLHFHAMITDPDGRRLTRQSPLSDGSAP